ncbi:hypothetical protein GCM10023259_101710 [Thermocatellispora tengchongensis]
MRGLGPKEVDLRGTHWPSAATASCRWCRLAPDLAPAPDPDLILDPVLAPPPDGGWDATVHLWGAGRAASCRRWRLAPEPALALVSVLPLSRSWPQPWALVSAPGPGSATGSRPYLLTAGRGRDATLRGSGVSGDPEWVSRWRRCA